MIGDIFDKNFCLPGLAFNSKSHVTGDRRLLLAVVTSLPLVYTCLPATYRPYSRLTTTNLIKFYF